MLEAVAVSPELCNQLCTQAPPDLVALLVLLIGLARELWWRRAHQQLRASMRPPAGGQGTEGPTYGPPSSGTPSRPLVLTKVDEEDTDPQRRMRNVWECPNGHHFSDRLCGGGQAPVCPECGLQGHKLPPDSGIA